VRKQYLRLARRPILWWSLRAFERTRAIAAVVVVVPGDDVLKVRQACRRWGFRKVTAVVAGGETRADSVREGLAALPLGARWISVHDAVRPLVTPKLIEQTLAGARRHRAAIAACPSRDTVKIATGGAAFIRETPERSRVWLAQTPQAFERSLLERAHARGRHLPATDDALLVERLGVRVALVESSPDNLKVTVPMDLGMAQRILHQRHIR